MMATAEHVYSIEESKGVDDLGAFCPLTGLQGVLLRHRDANELAESYSTYLEMPLPVELRRRYFQKPIAEYYCHASGLRWYSPTKLGESDFYEFLGGFAWYYDTQTWDK